MRHLKKFESLNCDEDSRKEIEDIFTDLDTNYPVDIHVFSTCGSKYFNEESKISVYIDPIREMSNGILKDSNINFGEIIKSIWEKIEFARKLGFETIDGNYGYITTKEKSNKSGHSWNNSKKDRFVETLDLNDNLFDGILSGDVELNKNIIEAQINFKP